MSNIKNLYILKPNVFSSNFAPLVLKDIENNYKIDQVAKIKFSQEEAVDFYKDSFFNHINKYGKKTAEQIRDKNASFMSSNDSLLLIISPKENLDIDPSVFIKESRGFAENLRVLYAQEHFIYHKCCNSIHSSDSLKSFNNDYNFLKNYINNEKYELKSDKYIRDSIIDFRAKVDKNIESSTSNILRYMQQLSNNSFKREDSISHEILNIYKDFLNNLSVENKGKYIFTNEAVGKKIELLKQKISYDLDNLAGKELFSKINNANTNVNLEAKLDKNKNQLDFDF